MLTFPLPPEVELGPVLPVSAELVLFKTTDPGFDPAVEFSELGGQFMAEWWGWSGIVDGSVKVKSRPPVKTRIVFIFLIKVKKQKISHLKAL